MLKALLILLICFLGFNQTKAGELFGIVTDKESGELLVGTTVYIKELKIGTLTGLDGTYLIKNIPVGEYTLICSYISFNTQETHVVLDEGKSRIKINFLLVLDDNELSIVTITGRFDKSTESNARLSEKNASNVMNIVSAKAIELSPDLNVANVIQRMSGVTLEKNVSGNSQYAILRGMDKRYNYTLINGIKIPSTHNKHRYVSLDLFPSDLVDRVEVTKALTADMEGDAIAGIVNMVMKNAPEKLLIQANAAIGYNTFFGENNSYLFSTHDINLKSPYELNPAQYNAVPGDFPKTNLVPIKSKVPVDYSFGLAIGNRFFKNKLGLILAGSYMNFYKGKSSLIFDSSTSNDGYDLPELSSMQERIYTEVLENSGIHTKIDYSINKKHSLELYSFYMKFLNTQVRESNITDLDLNYYPESGTYLQNHATRFRHNMQDLISTSLQGKHQLFTNLLAQWSVSYANAGNLTADQATIQYSSDYTNGNPEKSFVDFDGSERLWRHNSDLDLAAYLNFNYTPEIFGIKTTIKFGGLYRQKNRESFKTTYTLQATSLSKPSDSVFYSEKGVDWNKYDEINWRVYNPRGATANGETFDANENVFAGYTMIEFNLRNLLINGGLRIENTNQGYFMQFPIGQPRPDGEQIYTDILPSFHLKYVLKQKHNIRASYYKATNKPGFMEIVPCPVQDEDYTSQGNPDLKRTIADNIDLRWEYFPAALDQIMVGIFYKALKNPIEYAFVTIGGSSQKVTYSPINTDKAINKGIEIDVIKYFRQFGIKGNYTYTQSEISTTKLSRTRDENGNIVPDFNVVQKRPLYGQAAHMGNISLLYKSANTGMNAQLAFSYTGERLYTVSQVIDDDLWQKGYWQLDVSAEKVFKNGIGLFFKAHNLLNDNLIVYIKKVNTDNKDYPNHSINDSHTLIRDELTMRSFLLGIRYKLNK